MRLHRFEFRAMASSHELLLAGTDAMLAAHVAEAAIADRHGREAVHRAEAHPVVITSPALYALGHRIFCSTHRQGPQSAPSSRR